MSDQKTNVFKEYQSLSERYAEASQYNLGFEEMYGDPESLYGSFTESFFESTEKYIEHFAPHVKVSQHERVSRCGLFKLPNLPFDEIGKLRIEGSPNRGVTYYYEDKQQMVLSQYSDQVYWESYNHNFFAFGDVVATGLGVLTRESMLIDNPRITSITVLEICEELIEYHKKHNPEIMDKLNVINCDANEWEGTCDTYLMDHHEKGNLLENFLKCYQKVNCKQCWFWPLEICVAKYSDYVILRDVVPELPELSELDWFVVRQNFFRDRLENVLIPDRVGANFGDLNTRTADQILLSCSNQYAFEDIVGRYSSAEGKKDDITN